MYQNVKGNREKLQILAKKMVAHTSLVYSHIIQKSIESSIIYRDGSKFREEVKTLKNPSLFTQKPVIPHAVVGCSLKTIFEINNHHPFKKTAILSNANYKNAGGGFLKGQYKQEEALCHISTLYNVLSAFNKDYYCVNQRKVNNGYYTNAALYTPNILFENIFTRENLPQDFICLKDYNSKAMIDVISCTPPRKKLSFDEYVRDRFKFIKSICELNQIEILIIPNEWCKLLTYRKIYNIFSTSSTLTDIYFYAEPEIYYHNSIISSNDINTLTDNVKTYMLATYIEKKKKEEEN